MCCSSFNTVAKWSFSCWACAPNTASLKMSKVQLKPKDPEEHGLLKSENAQCETWQVTLYFQSSSGSLHLISSLLPRVCLTKRRIISSSPHVVSLAIWSPVPPASPCSPKLERNFLYFSVCCNTGFHLSFTERCSANASANCKSAVCRHGFSKPPY